jgi:hypothetical protein
MLPTVVRNVWVSSIDKAGGEEKSFRLTDCLDDHALRLADSSGRVGSVDHVSMKDLTVITDKDC